MYRFLSQSSKFALNKVSMDSLRFDNRVAIVTGAGGGLGRQYALLLGSRGASVVVNDLGGDIHGGGESSRPADLVVEEIKKAGGKAVSNYDSVEDGESIVRTALQNFGRVDILINNAGILRDKSFVRIGDEDWDIIHRVHLRGSFLVTRAAWPHMRKQGYGRIIMTASAAGVFGNFGQANYSAAKLGLLGLSNTLAIEGAKYNIHCNTIVPTAGSRLTQTVMPPDVIESLKPDYIAPVVAFLCHESNEDNGGAFEASAGWVARLRWEESQGAVLRKSKDDVVTIEKVRDNWEKINDFTNSLRPKTIQENTGRILQLVQEADASVEESNQVQEPDRLDGWIGFELPSSTFTYNTRDIALYALGVGVSVEDESGLRFLFEGHPEFSALPSFGIIVCQPAVMSALVGISSIDPTRILHGEQYLELKGALPVSATLTSKASITEVLDKGKGALIVCDVHTTDEDGRDVAFNQFVTYVGGAGGFGGRRSSDKIKPIEEVPTRQPDAIMEQQMSTDQAALYRLSGDYNPLHIDPSFAAMGGLPRPIVHGLCSLGFAVRHVMEKFAANDVGLFKAVKVRFSRPVMPGQTIQTQMWKSENDSNRIIMRCLVKETGETCLSGAYVDLKSGTTSDIDSSPESDSLKSSPIMEELSRRIAMNPELAKKTNAVFSLQIRGADGSIAKWTLDLRIGEIYRGQPKNSAAECSIEMADEDFVAMAMGKLNAQKAFMQGKLKVKGNIMLSQKLATIFNSNHKI